MGMLGHEEVSTLTTVTGWERVLLGLNSQSLTVGSDCRAGIHDHHVLGFHRCHLLASSQWQTELGVATPSYRWGNWGSEAIIYPRRRAELKFKIGPQATHLVSPRPSWETHSEIRMGLSLLSLGLYVQVGAGESLGRRKDGQRMLKDRQAEICSTSPVAPLQSGWVPPRSWRRVTGIRWRFFDLLKKKLGRQAMGQVGRK